MAKNHVFHVIGGQYKSILYGSFATLQEAKQCAIEHDEFRDNFVGWVKPSIYVDNDYYPICHWEGDEWVQFYRL